MKNSMFSAALGVLFVLCFGAFSPVQAQQNATSTNPFELGLAAGGFIKTMEGSMGLGGTLLAEPRYFFKENLALTARYQYSAYSAEPFGLPGGSSYDINVQSALAGVMFRHRNFRNSWFYGIQTGAAFTVEYLGEDQDGYAQYGNNQTFWVLAPRVGYAINRFEVELGYHFSPSREARFGQLTLGWRFWGNKKRVS